jgi:tetratricopeptide (TPR) repeat protein
MERTLDGVASWVAPAGAIACVGLVAIAVLAYRKGQRRAAFGFVWFLVAWLPISGLFPLNAPMAEHWMYVPMAGFFFGAAELIMAGLNRVPVVRSLAIIALAVWLVCLGVVTASRNRDWRGDEALYVATLRENPNSTRVHYNLGVVYQDILNNPAGARREFATVANTYRERKLKNPAEKNLFWSDELDAHVSLGKMLEAEYRFAEAFAHFRTVLSASPTGPDATLVAEAAYHAGRCFMATGDAQSAREYFQQAMSLAPQLRPEIERLLPLASETGPANQPRNP